MEVVKSNRGGARKGAGRKTKADENRVRTLSINAMKVIFGSEEKAFEHIAELAQESYPHLKMLFEYGYGKPKETKDVNINPEQPLFPKDVSKNHSG